MCFILLSAISPTGHTGTFAYWDHEMIVTAS